MIAFFQGFWSFFAAFPFIFKHRLYRWYIVPVLVWVVLMAGSTFTIAGWLTPVVKDLLDQWLGVAIPAEKPGFWENLRYWLHNGLSVANGWILTLLLWYLFGRVMKYVILIITSPLLAWLSEKTEEIITGKVYPFSWWQLLKDSWRGIRIALRNLFLELIFMGLGFVLSFFFPVWGIFITAVLFLVNCYFMGFSMFDYYTERQKMDVSKSIVFMRNRRMRVIGLGLAFNLTAFVPFADWVVAPINGAVGAVLSLRGEGTVA